MKKLLILLGMGSILLLGSCKKDKKDIEPIFNGDITTLVAPDNFDWKTHRDVSFEFTSPITGIIEIKNQDGITLHKAFLNSGSKLEIDLGIAAYQTKVFVAFLGNEIELPISSATIKHNF
jgi:hypothetical protein